MSLVKQILVQIFVSFELTYYLMQSLMRVRMVGLLLKLLCLQKFKISWSGIWNSRCVGHISVESCVLNQTLEKNVFPSCTGGLD
jgi:hypothetical protein